MLLAQPITGHGNPQKTTDDIRIPCKHQARLDDNGEPAGVPAPKKKKSADQDGPKKKVPAKTGPQNLKEKKKKQEMWLHPKRTHLSKQ
jgi:hypothetical protein